jgi:hypothetical protein
MKVPSIHELKEELKNLDKKELIEACTRLARAKTENKELLAYVLFHSANEAVFIQDVKDEMSAQFDELNKSNFYLAKKTIRKVLRTANKNIRFSQKKQTEIELRIFFCMLMRSSTLAFQKHAVLLNLYNNQVKKIKGLVDKLDEDLQFDYRIEIEKL